MKAHYVLFTMLVQASIFSRHLVSFLVTKSFIGLKKA